MSAIGEIMGLSQSYSDAQAHSGFHRNNARRALRDAVAAAIADARREGAEQMRAASEESVRSLRRRLSGTARQLASECAVAITALPLPTGPRVVLPTAAHRQADGSRNCMQCAVAYMLGLPVDETPDFEREHSPQRTAWERMEEFFGSHGCTVEMFPPNAEITGDYIASGTTARGTSHMVVMRGGKLLHDPHPSNAGLQSIQVVWLIARMAGPSAEFTGPRQAVRPTDERGNERNLTLFGAT